MNEKKHLKKRDASQYYCKFGDWKLLTQTAAAQQEEETFTLCIWFHGRIVSEGGGYFLSVLHLPLSLSSVSAFPASPSYCATVVAIVVRATDHVPAPRAKLPLSALCNSVLGPPESLHKS